MSTNTDQPDLEKSVDSLREMIEIQLSHGNYDYDPYMHGMANGMIFALSLFDGRDPEYLNAPDKWLCDTGDDKQPETVDK